MVLQFVFLSSLSHQSSFTPSVSGLMSSGSTQNRILNRVHTVTARIHGRAGGCLWPGEAHEMGRGNYKTTQLYIRSLNASSWLCDLLVKQYDWGRRRQQPVEERCGTILDLLLFLCSTTFHHCVSWSLHQSTEAFFFYLTVYLMPYLLLRFWMCLAEFAKSVYPFVFSSSCTWAEVYRTLDTHHFGFEEQSTIIHTCWADAQCKIKQKKNCKSVKTLYVNYQY